LKVKKQQAIVVIEFRKNFKDKEKRPEYYLKMKELNKRNLNMSSCND
jgi:hypothetical protein